MKKKISVLLMMGLFSILIFSSATAEAKSVTRYHNYNKNIFTGSLSNHTYTKISVPNGHKVGLVTWVELHRAWNYTRYQDQYWWVP